MPRGAYKQTRAPIQARDPRALACEALRFLLDGAPGQPGSCGESAASGRFPLITNATYETVALERLTPQSRRAIQVFRMVRVDGRHRTGRETDAKGNDPRSGKLDRFSGGGSRSLRVYFTQESSHGQTGHSPRSDRMSQ